MAVAPSVEGPFKKGLPVYAVLDTSGSMGRFEELLNKKDAAPGGEDGAEQVAHQNKKAATTVGRWDAKELCKPGNNLLFDKLRCLIESRDIWIES